MATLADSVAALPACTARLRVPLAAEEASQAAAPSQPATALVRSIGSAGSALFSQLPEAKPPDSPASVSLHLVYDVLLPGCSADVSLHMRSGLCAIASSYHACFESRPQLLSCCAHPALSMTLPAGTGGPAAGASRVSRHGSAGADTS